MKQELKSAIRPFRRAVRRLSPRALGNRIAGVGFALFDPSTDLLKVPQSAAEMLADLDGQDLGHDLRSAAGQRLQRT